MSKALIAVCALTAAWIAAPPAHAFDESKYPNLKGQWERIGSPRWDDEHAPLTPEYQAIYKANLKDMAEGGQGIDPTYTCMSPGMPRIMNVYDPMEIVVTPGTTHILIQHIHDGRRIYTDGRDWPKYLDKADRNLLHDDITVRDHALTRPFSANKKYSRAPEAQPVWLESQCPDGNHHVLIGKENYYVSEDGFLMPVKKNQTPPDLRYFKGK